VITWPRIAGFLLIGYLCAKRSFAYLGVPPLFIGEIVLGAFLLLKPRVVLGTWVASLLRASPLNELGLALLVFVLYGVWQVGRGVLSGHPLIYTMKFFVFNYYTLYIFLGIWVALREPELMPKLIRVLAWLNGIYGMLFLVALRHVPIYMPGYDGVDVPLFSPPSGQVVVILGLLCFERDLRAVWFVLLLNIVITLAWQVRAEWLGLALGIFTWGLLTGRLGRVVAIGMAAVAVLGLIELAGIDLAGRRGYEVSLSENIARVVAPIDLELAKELSPRAAKHAGTAEWRELWWEQIWLSAHSAPMLEAFGHGYGFDLWGLAPAEINAGQVHDDVRTPHSVFYYALGYTGWVGVVLFCLLQITILKLLWRSYRVGGQPAGIALWVLGMGMALFQESFETPQRAIPFYLLVGMTIAPGLQSGRAWHALPARAASSAGQRGLSMRPTVRVRPS
jgi:O-Antigen ligase